MTHRILIVGGGSAGWITAAYMDAMLNSPEERVIDITLIESSRVGRIGVGEATIPTMQRTLRRIGISERDFMRATDATFKQAILFRNWRHVGHRYYHPFDRWLQHINDPENLNWLRSDRSVPFASAVTPQPAITDLELAPKTLQDPDYVGRLNYAYHLDAEKYAEYLASIATGRGVNRIIADVVDVLLSGPETISGVRTADGETYTADLYVDCTGFAQLLIGKLPAGDWESFADHLLCDRALATRIPYEANSESKMRAYTISTALKNGWVWDISLQGRRGVGYVYSSKFVSDEDALKEFQEFEGPHARDLEFKKIGFRSGRVPRPWTGNCVAIGLAGGFIEPLESTGIYFIEDGVDYLCGAFPRFGDMDRCRALYNGKIQERYRENRDFVNLHYVLSQRDDSAFWREAVKPEHVAPRLAEWLELWESKLPGRLDFTDLATLYNHVNYEYVLYGMD